MRNFTGETCFECMAGDEYCNVYTTERWCKGKIDKWMKKYPGKFKNFKKTEDGSYSIQIPARSMRSFTFRDKKEKKNRNIEDEKKREIICKAQKGRIRKMYEKKGMSEEKIEEELLRFEEKYWQKFEEEDDEDDEED